MIQSTGIEPDIMVELAVVEDIEKGALHEEDLRGALENDNGEAEDGTDGEGGNQVNLEDYQLARAIDLLRGINVFRAINN